MMIGHNPDSRGTHEYMTDGGMNLDTLVFRRKACRLCMESHPGQIVNGSETDFDPFVVSYWSQWLGNPKPRVVIVGQDFSDVGYFKRNYGRDEVGNRTNLNLRLLLAEAGIVVGDPPSPDSEAPVYLTNSVLCLKTGAMNSPLKPRWVKTCAANHLTPLLTILNPTAVIGMGGNGWAAVRQVAELSEAPKAIGSAAGGRWRGSLLMDVFAVGHCSGLGLVNRPWSLQIADWKRIGAALQTLPQ